jgi:hypothetical protein
LEEIKENTQKADIKEEVKESEQRKEIKEDIKEVTNKIGREENKEIIDKREQKRIQRNMRERERRRMRKINPSFEITLSGKNIIVTANEIRSNVAILEEVFNDLIKRHPSLYVETRMLSQLTQIFAVVNLIAKNSIQ